MAAVLDRTNNPQAIYPAAVQIANGLFVQLPYKVISIIKINFIGDMENSLLLNLYKLW